MNDKNQAYSQNNECTNYAPIIQYNGGTYAVNTVIQFLYGYCVRLCRCSTKYKEWMCQQLGYKKELMCQLVIGMAGLSKGEFCCSTFLECIVTRLHSRTEQK